MTQRLDFIDVSHYQADAGTINWSKVAQTVSAVIIKASQGTSYKDPKYQSNRTGAEAAGLAVATYHYLEHGDVQNQMHWYLKCVNPAPGERMVIDYEDTPCTAEDLEAACRFLEENTDAEVTVYGAAKLRDDVNEYSGSLKYTKRTSLWAARYSSSEPDIATKVWPVWTAWQYSQSGKIEGIEGAVDCNMFNGSHSQMLKWFGPAQKPVPAPEKNVLVALTVDPGVKLTVTVNGEPLGD